MAPRHRGRTPAPWSLTDLVLVAVVGLFLTAVLAVPAGVLTFIAGELAEAEVSILVLFAVLGSAFYGALVLASWLMVVERRKVAWSALGFRRVRARLLLAMVPAGLGLLVLNLVLIVRLTFFLGLGNPEAAGGQDEIFEPEGGLDAVDVLLLAIPFVLLAPVVEELIFRGLLYRYLRGRMSLVLAVVLSALIFAVLHAVIPPLFLMGVVLAILAERTGSLLPGIVLHATNNALVLLAIWLPANLS